MPSFTFCASDQEFYPVLAPVSRSYPDLTGSLPTCYSPIRRSFHKRPSEDFSLLPAHDLHVLGMPPAFVLSQDQTLQKSLTYKQRGCLYGILASFCFKSVVCHTDCEKHLYVSLSYRLFCSVFKEQISCLKSSHNNITITEEDCQHSVHLLVLLHSLSI